MNLETIGRVLVMVSIVLFLVGLFLVGLSRLGFNQLPGDILIRRGNIRIYFPVATGLAISILLTVVLNVLIWWWRR